MLLPQSVGIGNKGFAHAGWRSQPPTETIGLGELETSRQKLGESLFSGFALFFATLPTIINGGVLLSPVAKPVAAVLDTLLAAIRGIGGLRKLVALLLYVDPATGQIHYWLPELTATTTKEE